MMFTLDSNFIYLQGKCIFQFLVLVGEIAQQIKAHTSLGKDSNLIPNIHVR